MVRGPENGREEGRVYEELQRFASKFFKKKFFWIVNINLNCIPYSSFRYHTMNNSLENICFFANNTFLF